MYCIIHTGNSTQVTAINSSTAKYSDSSISSAAVDYTNIEHFAESTQLILSDTTYNIQSSSLASTELRPSNFLFTVTDSDSVSHPSKMSDYISSTELRPSNFLSATVTDSVSRPSTISDCISPTKTNRGHLLSSTNVNFFPSSEILTKLNSHEQINSATDNIKTSPLDYSQSLQASSLHYDNLQESYDQLLSTSTANSISIKYMSLESIYSLEFSVNDFSTPRDIEYTSLLLSSHPSFSSLGSDLSHENTGNTGLYSLRSLLSSQSSHVTVKPTNSMLPLSYLYYNTVSDYSTVLSSSSTTDTNIRNESHQTEQLFLKSTSHIRRMLSTNVVSNSGHVVHSTSNDATFDLMSFSTRTLTELIGINQISHSSLSIPVPLYVSSTLSEQTFIHSFLKTSIAKDIDTSMSEGITQHTSVSITPLTTVSDSVYTSLLIPEQASGQGNNLYFLMIVSVSVVVTVCLLIIVLLIVIIVIVHWKVFGYDLTKYLLNSSNPHIIINK